MYGSKTSAAVGSKGLEPSSSPSWRSAATVGATVDSSAAGVEPSVGAPAGEEGGAPPAAVDPSASVGPSVGAPSAAAPSVQKISKI